MALDIVLGEKVRRNGTIDAKSHTTKIHGRVHVLMWSITVELCVLPISICIIGKILFFCRPSTRNAEDVDTIHTKLKVRPTL